MRQVEEGISSYFFGLEVCLPAELSKHQLYLYFPLDLIDKLKRYMSMQNPILTSLSESKNSQVLGLLGDQGMIALGF
jgi:hypothetical protein